MPLAKFRVGNYRSFVEPTELDVRPLTLLFGYNNSGKSALARVLPLVRDSLREPHGLPLNLASPATRGADFADLRSKSTGTRKLELGLTWDAPPLAVDFVLRDLPERRQHVVEGLEISRSGAKALSAEWVVPTSGAVPATTTYRFTAGQEAGIEEQVRWVGLIPRLAGSALGANARSALDACESVLTEIGNTYWVGAIRVPPPRLAALPAQPPERIEYDGRGAADVLAWDRLVGGPLYPVVGGWYANHAKAPLEVLLRPESFSLVVGAHQVNLCDTGEGLTQVLPVLVAAALAQRDAQAQKPAYVVVEQPELHLHPAAHAPLAEYFCDIAASASCPRMIVETHSENFMYGVQLAIASGRLSRDAVIMYWVRQEDGRSTATPILFDEEGRPDGWPRQVFSEDAELAKKLLAVRAARHVQ